MPLWILYLIPEMAAAGVAGSIMLGSSPIAAVVAGVLGLTATAAAFVTVPASLYAMMADHRMRSVPHVIGTALCALPVLLLIASFLLGGV